MHSIIINEALDDLNIQKHLEDIGYTFERKIKDYTYVISHKNVKFIAKIKDIHNEEELLSFENDYYVCRKLNDHKNVEHVYDYYIFITNKPKYFCLITAYYEYSFNKQDVMHIMRDICEGVQELLNNAHHYIHVNPENILYDASSDCYVCSLFAHDPYYLPPEYMNIHSYETTGKHYPNFYEFLRIIDNANKEKKYHNGHIFSLGLCMYYFLKGTLPRLYKSEIEMYKGISKEERMILEIALADLPKKRFSDANAMIKAIDMMDEFYYSKGALNRISKEKRKHFHTLERSVHIKSYLSHFFKFLVIASILLTCLFSGKLFAKKESNSTQYTTTYIKNTYLDNLTPIKKNNVMFFSDNPIQTNTNKIYSHYIQPLSIYSEITYHLNGEYDYFKATWALIKDNSKIKDNHNFDIYLDNELVYSSQTLTLGDEPSQLLLELNQCNTLSIIFKEGHGNAILCNPYLYNKEQKELSLNKQNFSLSCFITELDYMNKSGFIYPHAKESKTFRNNPVSHYIEGSYGDSISYFVNKKYKKLSGVWAIKQNKNTLTPQQFEVYGDDKCIFISQPITCKDYDTSFEIDISNYKKITFLFSKGTGAGIIANIRLTPTHTYEKNIENYITELNPDGKWLNEFDDFFTDSDIKTSSKKAKSHTGHIITHHISGKDGGIIVYYLDGHYKYFDGLWTILKNNRNTIEEQQFSIYSNNDIIYESPVITGNDCTVPFHVNIEGCYEMKIIFNKGDHSGVIANGQLIKK